MHHQESASHCASRLLRLTASVFIGILLTTALPAAADFGSVYRLTVMPGTDEAHVPLGGWIVGADTQYFVEVVDEPRFGTWVNEVFTPHDDFWRYGGDRVVLRVTTFQGTSLKTIVLRVGEPLRRWSSTEDFESGSLTASELTILGDSSKVYVTDASIAGDYSLAIDVQGGGGGVQGRTAIGGGITGVDHKGGNATINPDLPGGGGGGGGNAPITSQPFRIFHLNRAVDVWMEAVGSGDAISTFVWLEADDRDFGCAPNCTTPPRQIPVRENTEIKVWYGSDVLFHPSAGAPSIHLVIDHPDPAYSHHDVLRNLDRAPAGGLEWAVGALGETPGTLTGTIKIDSVEAYVQEVGVHNLPTVLGEDFAGGSWDDRWDLLGPFEVVAPARSWPVVEWSGKVDLKQVSPSFRALLVDDGPRDETSVRIELEVALGAANIGNGIVYTIWGATPNEGTLGDSSADHSTRIEVQFIGGTPHLRARALDTFGVEHATSWLPVDLSTARAGGVPVVLQWWGQRSQYSAPGSLTFRVDDQSAELTGLINWDQMIQEHGVGVWSIDSAGALPSFLGSAPRVLIDNVIAAY